MRDVNAQGILLRRIDYGDNDLIVTFFTPEVGKITTIAKSAKKSKKRFPGILELFSHLALVYSQNQRQNLPILKEASLLDAFIHIRSDIYKTGYASYWVELIHFWLQEGKAQTHLYYLLQQVLGALNQERISAEVLNIYFQMKFLKFAGFAPNLESCSHCQTDTDGMNQTQVTMSLADGGLVCCQCCPNRDTARHFSLSKGTLKQLVWMADRDLPTAARVRFSNHGLKEALDFLESFVPYHVGKIPKSLKFLKSLRAF